MFRSLKKRMKGMANGSGSDSNHGSNNDSSSEHNSIAVSAPNLSTPSAAREQAATTTSAIRRRMSTGSSATRLNNNNSNNKTGMSTTEASSPVPSFKRNKRKGKRGKEPVLSISELTSKVSQLACFDSCVDAADALAASSHEQQLQKDSGHGGTILSGRVDKKSGLPDCSVLVSPDGNLLLLPTGNDAEDNNNNDHVKDKESSDHTNQQEEDSSSNNLFSELMLHGQEDYDSAVYLGNDLDINGDKSLNGFSARGWSTSATSYALRQTQVSLQHLQTFCEASILNKKEAAARTSLYCDEFCQTMPALGGHAPYGEWQDLESMNQTTGNRSRASSHVFGPTTKRTGPFTAPDSSLNQALVALQSYHARVAEEEGNRWRQASLQRKAVLPMLNEAIEKFTERSQKRLGALDEQSRRARFMEERFALLRKEADQKWQDVYRTEEEATRRHEALLQERSRLREQERLNQLAEQQSAAGEAGETLGATSEEIWDMVSAISESMQDGSFEPMDLPSAPLSTPRDKASNVKSANNNSDAAESKEGGGATTVGSDATSPMTLTSASSDGGAATSPPTKTTTTTAAAVSPNTALSDDSSVVSGASSIPAISREQVEEELNLPALRALAMAADDAVDDAAGSLLNILSNLDTTRRSARVAAETALVSAGNAQVTCIQSLVNLERASLEARLAHLNELESATQNIQVRSDLNTYITLDKKERGGTSHLGDDDDGGIASALAVLSSHVDGNQQGGNNGACSSRKGSEDSDAYNDGDDDDDASATRETLHAALETLFSKKKGGAGQQESASSTPSEADVQSSVEFLCKTACEPSPASRARRSTICYALNSKRSGRVEIASIPQFEGLCKLFASVLTACASDEGGMSNAKMLMMLAQTFYISSNGTEDNGLMDDVNLKDSAARSPVRKTRSQRVYIRNRLMDHPIWSKDDFWDEVLSEQIAESLTQSGVMSNFSGSGGGSRRRGTNTGGSYRQTRKSKWYDLSYEERMSAASQVHAVVFAQLGALAHSMIEFGCGLERSCAFVRRMSIRNQLPTAQRTMLLQHLIDRDDIDRRESTLTTTTPAGAASSTTATIASIAVPSLSPSVTAPSLSPQVSTDELNATTSK